MFILARSAVTVIPLRDESLTFFSLNLFLQIESCISNFIVSQV